MTAWIGPKCWDEACGIQIVNIFDHKGSSTLSTTAVCLLTRRRVSLERELLTFPLSSTDVAKKTGRSAGKQGRASSTTSKQITRGEGVIIAVSRSMISAMAQRTSGPNFLMRRPSWPFRPAEVAASIRQAGDSMRAS